MSLLEQSSKLHQEATLLKPLNFLIDFMSQFFVVFFFFVRFIFKFIKLFLRALLDDFPSIVQVQFFYPFTSMLKDLC
jgi:hypothetical protein